MSRYDRLFNRAVGVALTSDHPKQKHGAILFAGTRILAWGVNSVRNDPGIDYENATFHAEVAAARMWFRLSGQSYSGGSLEGLGLFVARVNRAGDPMMSKPCEDCGLFLRERGIQTVDWTEELPLGGLVG